MLVGGGSRRTRGAGGGATWRLVGAAPSAGGGTWVGTGTRHHRPRATRGWQRRLQGRGRRRGRIGHRERGRRRDRREGPQGGAGGRAGLGYVARGRCCPKGGPNRHSMLGGVYRPPPRLSHILIQPQPHPPHAPLGLGACARVKQPTDSAGNRDGLSGVAPLAPMARVRVRVRSGTTQYAALSCTVSIRARRRQVGHTRDESR